MEAVKYLTVDQVVNSSAYPFTYGQMRHYLMYRHRNGLEKAVRKIGRRIFINIDAFDKWIESRQANPVGVAHYE